MLYNKQKAIKPNEPLLFANYEVGCLILMDYANYAIAIGNLPEAINAKNMAFQQINKSIHPNMENLLKNNVWLEKFHSGN
jgi:hypothetical protein